MAREAAMLMDPQQYPISLPPMVDHVVLDRATSYDEALAWFTAMKSMGWYLVHLGDLDRALATCLGALEHAQTSGDSPGEADTWDSLALAYQRLGRLEDALAAAERAAEQYEALGDHVSAARSGLQAGDLSEDLGDRSRARRAWQQALVVDNADPEIRSTLTHRLDGASG